MPGTTFAQSILAREAKWSFICTIEGSGSYAGLYKYCTQVPDYAAADPLYRPWLMDWPVLVDEETDEEGGIPASGELELRILDYEDALTSEFRIDADPVTFLAGDLTSSGGSLNLDSFAPFTAGSSIAYFGNECVRITSGSGPFTVTRGWLDTDRFPHSDGDPVYAYTPYISPRRVRVYLAPIDGSSSAQETEFGQYAIDKPELTDDRCGWLLRAKFQQKWLSRVCSRRPPHRFKARGTIGRNNSITVELARESIDAHYSSSPPTWDGQGRFYVKVGDEIAVAGMGQGGMTFWDRALLGTTQGEIEDGATIDVIFAADDAPPPNANPPGSVPSFFRFSPGPTPATDETGTWNPSAQWIDLLLNLMTSSADPADELRFNNRNDAYGAWDCLPEGLGIGALHSQIDLAAATAIKSLCPEERFPDFYLSPEPVVFADLVTEAFLRPIGAYLSMSGGLARIVRPRTPLAGVSSLTLGPDDVLRRKVGKRRYEPIMSALRMDTGENFSSVIKANFKDDKLIIRASNFGRSARDTPGYYATEEKPIELEIPFARTTRNGTVDFIYEACRHKFLRFRRPRWAIDEIKFAIEQYGAGPGSLVNLTIADLPDLAPGRRGWSAMVLEILRRCVRLTPELGAEVTWAVKAYGSNERVGRVSPSARIVSVANAGGGHPDVTVSANRYTQPDVVGFPTTDAAALTVNDVLRLRNRNATDAGGGLTATVENIAGNVVRLSGTFGGVLANGTGNAGLVLEFASRASQIAQQYDRFVSFADNVALNVGASNQTPWRYA